jgi:prophage regulatory protein
VSKSEGSPSSSTPRLLSWPVVRSRVPLSRATVWALRRKGKFPQPIAISPGRKAWIESDIDSWIAAGGCDAYAAPASAPPGDAEHPDDAVTVEPMTVSAPTPPAAGATVSRKKHHEPRVHETAPSPRAHGRRRSEPLTSTTRSRPSGTSKEKLDERRL